jgi:hypothetical protein
MIDHEEHIALNPLYLLGFEEGRLVLSPFSSPFIKTAFRWNSAFFVPAFYTRGPLTSCPVEP